MWQKCKQVQPGDMIQFTEPVFLGRYPASRCLGDRYISARVTDVADGERKTIAFEVLASTGIAPLPVGSKHRRLSRNILKRAYKFEAEVAE